MGLQAGYDACMETEQRTDQPAILDNGAVVLEYTEKEQAGNGWRRNGVGICHRNNERDPFVVWNLIQDEDGGWFAESGDYCQTLIYAVDRYRDRGGK